MNSNNLPNEPTKGGGEKPYAVIEHNSSHIKSSLSQSYSESSQSSSSSSGEEEKRQWGDTPPEFADPAIISKPSKQKSKTHKSILKSAFLTNKRNSKYNNEFESKGKSMVMPEVSGSFRKIKTVVEGRLPIRRPSAVDPSVMGNKLNQNHAQLPILARTMPKTNTQEDSKEDKGELEYINHNEDSDIEDLNSFLSRSVFTNKFQIVWSILLFLSHTYHMLSFWYYLGIVGFPENELLALQLFFEFVLVIDFVLRL
jgi:hypothetical protein